MKLAYVLGLSACAAFVAAAGAASAATTIYGASGYVVSAKDAPGATGSCAAFSQHLGDPVSTQFYYPGSGVVGFNEVTSGTSPTSTTSNSTVTYTCVDGSGAPALTAGKTTPTYALACYADTMSGPASSAVIALTQSIAVVPTGAAGVKNANVLNMEVTTNFLGSGFQTLCTTISDETWIKQ